jgi:hypothetical protein
VLASIQKTPQKLKSQSGTSQEEKAQSNTPVPVFFGKFDGDFALSGPSDALEYRYWTQDLSLCIVIGYQLLCHPLQGSLTACEERIGSARYEPVAISYGGIQISAW